MMDNVSGVASAEEGQTYEEAMEDFWNELKEIEDPWERALYAQEELYGTRQSALSVVVLNAIAYDLAAETFK